MLTFPTPSANRFALFATALFTLAVLTGCSGGPPSEGEAGSKLNEVIQERSGGVIELTDLQKMDGQTREESGVSIYEMDVEGKIEAVEDGHWNVRSGPGGSLFSAPEGSPQMGAFANPDFMNATESAKGDRYGISGSLRFEEKESGWNLSDIDVRVTSSE